MNHEDLKVDSCEGYEKEYEKQFHGEHSNTYGKIILSGAVILLKMIDNKRYILTNEDQLLLTLFYKKPLKTNL